MPYLGYLLAQALKAGDTIAQAITSASNFVTKVGGSVVDLSPSVEALKSPSDGSASFNGTSDRIVMGNVLNQGAENATYSYWMYSTEYNTGQAAIAKSNGGSYSTTYGYLVGIQSNTKLYYFTADTDGSNHYSYIDHPGLNNWYHIAFSVDKSKSEVDVYVNGEAKTVTRNNLLSSIGTVTNTIDFVIGDESDGASTHNFGGNLANVAVWSRALSASEIRSVMNKSYDDLNASETQGLVSWYALDNITGTTVPDSQGNYNGTAY